MNQKSIWTAIILIFSLLAVSCTGSDDDSLLTTTDITQIITQADGWKVTWFWDKDKDETSDFEGYEFYFLESGTFEAVHSGNTVSGTWQVESSSDGSRRLVLNTSSDIKPLSEMNDDWIILKMTDSKIELKDDNDEHLEELHFEKI